jgi:hypothetical protein
MRVVMLSSWSLLFVDLIDGQAAAMAARATSQPHPVQ